MSKSTTSNTQTYTNTPLPFPQLRLGFLLLFCVRVSYEGIPGPKALQFPSIQRLSTFLTPVPLPPNRLLDYLPNQTSLSLIPPLPQRKPSVERDARTLLSSTHSDMSPFSSLTEDERGAPNCCSSQGSDIMHPGGNRQSSTVTLTAVTQKKRMKGSSGTSGITEKDKKAPG